MQDFGSIISFAISEEEAAARFYYSLADRVTRPGMKELFLGFAREEEGHKRKLMGIEETGTVPDHAAAEPDLKVSDYLIDVKPTDDMAYQDALIVAMKKETTAQRMYSDLSRAATDPTIKKLFLSLADEEANHKNRFEKEYDDFVMSEN